AAREIGQLSAGIITVSDTRTEETDESGRLLRELLTGAGHSVEAYAIVKDEMAAIRRTVLNFAERVDFIVVNGGTGMTPRDVTIEACRPLFSKEVEGFGELFRILSFEEIGSAALM